MLISGLGIAGPALAHWALHHGMQPTLVERASHLRQGGYIIDFWGLGYELVERMGLLDEVRAAGYQIQEVRLVDGSGHRVGGFDASIFRAATLGRFTSLPRGDLSRILYRSIESRAEIAFGNCITALEQEGGAVLVHFERGPARRFDVVIGADGLHSALRRLVFGNESFEKFLGYGVAAFSLPGYRPRDENVYVSHAVPGKTVSRLSMRDDRTLFLFVSMDAEAPPADALDAAAQKAHLRRRFADVGWECPHILAGLDSCGDLYLDRVSQLRMPRWYKGRIALLGDAAFAPSLLAGQGAALAIIAAHVLAGELARAESPAAAFYRYEALLQGFLASKQRAALRFAQSFVPHTRLAVKLRNLATRAFSLPLVPRLALGTSLLDQLQLPNYG